MKYTVSAGDNLITIAKKYQVSLKELMDLNSIKTPNLIYLGQEIDIPEDGEQLESKGLTGSNINAKIEDFINFLEGKKLKKQLDIDSKRNIANLFETCLQFNVTDLKEVAYILATVHWETNRTYNPIEEYGKGRGHDYGVPYKGTGKVYYGRGFVQLTWYNNYARFTQILSRLGYNVDLINYPEQACNADIAAKIIVAGMRDGNFTGHRLDDYFNPLKADWFNARQIINKTDRAVIIKEIALEMYYILK